MRPAPSIKNQKGISMHYIIQILAAILIGVAFGALLEPRNNLIVISSILAIALGVVTFFTLSWVPLAIGTAVFVVVQCLPRERSTARA
jgi:hypothetical protein